MSLRSQRGFTLVEVLVALAVLAIALAAVMRTMAQAIDATSSLRDGNTAMWVAQNLLAEHRIRRHWPAVDTIDGEVDMAGKKWFWRQQVSTTPESQIRRVEITVKRAPDAPDSQATLVGYLRNPVAAKPGGT